MESIQLEQDNLFKIGIKNAEGEDTGEIITIDLEDIKLPLKCQESEKMIKDNNKWLQAQRIIIEKRPDKKGKKLLSANEEALLKLVNEYYEKQTKAYELVLGEGAIKKRLCGREIYITFFSDLEEQMKKLRPKLNQNVVDIKTKINSIVEKYGQKDSDVMESWKIHNM